MRLWRINRLFEENEFWGEKNIDAPTPIATVNLTVPDSNPTQGKLLPNSAVKLPPSGVEI
jgi:hypothetical protein